MLWQIVIGDRLLCVVLLEESERSLSPIAWIGCAQMVRYFDRCDGDPVVSGCAFSGFFAFGTGASPPGLRLMSPTFRPAGYPLFTFGSISRLLSRLRLNEMALTRPTLRPQT